jgi:hypothetical protein
MGITQLQQQIFYRRGSHCGNGLPMVRQALAQGGKDSWQRLTQPGDGQRDRYGQGLFFEPVFQSGRFDTRITAAG